MHSKLTFHDVKNALSTIESIARPEGDNEGDPINSETVYPLLDKKDQRKVDAAEVVGDYVRNSDGTPNRRAITTLNRNGYSTAFHTAQEDPLRMVGRVICGNWEFDISDPLPDSDDD